MESGTRGQASQPPIHHQSNPGCHVTAELAGVGLRDPGRKICSPRELSGQSLAALGFLLTGF